MICVLILLHLFVILYISCFISILWQHDSLKKVEKREKNEKNLCTVCKQQGLLYLERMIRLQWPMSQGFPFSVCPCLAAFIVMEGTGTAGLFISVEMYLAAL